MTAQPPAAPESDVSEWAEILAEHSGWGNNRKPSTECRWLCNCGEALDNDFSGVNVIARYQRHVASIIATAARERVRVVEGERDAAQLALGEQADIEREAFGRGVAWAMGDDEEAPAKLTARAESAEAAHEALRKECADHLRAIESAHDAALSAARIRTLEAALHAQAQQDRAETAETEVERLTESALPSPDDTDEKETA